MWFLENYCGKWDYPTTKEECLAWLEKQKESLHISESCKENAEYFAQCGDNRFELIDKARRDIIAKTNVESSPDEMKVLDSFLFRAWQMGWLGKYDVIVPEQKPAEWSEEDENIRKALVWHLKADVDFVSNGVTKAECLAYLDKQKVQKQWWGKEDERILKGIIGLIDHNQHYDVSNKDMLNWLKSLRPQPHWKLSKEEIDAFENLLKGDFPNKIFPGTTLANLLNKLKKLYYNEAIQVWKPSEEQMYALGAVVKGYEGGGIGDSLKELYEQLKSL